MVKKRVLDDKIKALATLRKKVWVFGAFVTYEAIIL